MALKGVEIFKFILSPKDGERTLIEPVEGPGRMILTLMIIPW